MQHGPVGSSRDQDQAAEAAAFVSGGFGSTRDWEDLISRVGQFCRVVTPDILAAGDVVEDRARRLDAALGGLGIGRVHLVLHGSGGPAGLLWAAGHPGAFASATLIDADLLSGPPWRRLLRVLRSLRRPALVVCGARDRHLPAGYAERHRELFPDARIVLLEEAGNGLFSDDPEAVADEVVLFLRRHLSGAAPNSGTQENARYAPRPHRTKRPTEGDKDR